MTELPSLNYKEKVLIHLKEFYKVKNYKELPEEVTQEGISDHVGMSRTHVSRVVRNLMDEDLVLEKQSNIIGRKRKLKTYHLTHEGFLKSKELLSDLSDVDVQVLIRGEIEEISLTDIEDLSDGYFTVLEAIRRLEEGDERINLDEKSPSNPVKEIDEAPEISELYGRDEEYRKLNRWLNEPVPVLVLLGRKGFGTSSLASKLVREIDDRHVLWINITEKTGEEILDKIEDFYDDICQKSYDLYDEFKTRRCLLVFDDYYDVPDKIVDFLSDYMEVVEKTDNTKIILNSREGTPVYERFYQIEDLDDGKVKEMKLSPLNKKQAQELLGSAIEEESLRRIMQFTKGSPLLLKLLKEGDREKLEEVSYLGKEQISLLMFLKSKTK